MSKKTVFLTLLLVLMFVLSSITISFADSGQCLVVRKADDSLWVASTINGNASSFSEITGKFVSQPTVVWDEGTARYYLYGTGLHGAVFKRTLDPSCNTLGGWVKMTADDFSDSPIGASGGGRFLNVVFTNSGTKTISTSVTNILSRTIVCPDGGFVAARASGTVETNRSGSNSSWVHARLNLASTSQGTSQWFQDFRNPANTPAGLTTDAFTLQGWFNVSGAGNKTVYFTGARNISCEFCGIKVLYPTLLLEYFPYGY